jgi:tetratricopeptide (TPR) repeat protein
MRTSSFATERRALAAALFFTAAARAQEAQSRFVEGLQLLASGKFEQAAEAFGKAVDADAKVAAYHLDRAVALMLLERGADAKRSLARAAELEPKNGDVQVWSHARLLMFEPGTAPARHPSRQRRTRRRSSSPPCRSPRLPMQETARDRRRPSSRSRETSRGNS